MDTLVAPMRAASTPLCLDETGDGVSVFDERLFLQQFDRASHPFMHELVQSQAVSALIGSYATEN